MANWNSPTSSLSVPTRRDIPNEEAELGSRRRHLPEGRRGGQGGRSGGRLGLLGKPKTRRRFSQNSKAQPGRAPVIPGMLQKGFTGPCSLSAAFSDPVLPATDTPAEPEWHAGVLFAVLFLSYHGESC